MVYLFAYFLMAGWQAYIIIFIFKELIQQI